MSKRYQQRIAWAAFAALLSSSVPALQASVVDVRIELPVRARIDLEGKETVTLAPCLVFDEEGEESSYDLDLVREFERYVSRLIGRKTDLKFVESGPVDYPVFDLKQLGDDSDFWAFIGSQTQADLILSCSLDFDVQERSGYRTEEYVSPFDGRTYYRQVLVEATGFDFDIVLQVYEGQSGEQLHHENFRDFREFPTDSADPVTGMFANLQALEDRIAGIFVQRRVAATRALYSE